MTYDYKCSECESIQEEIHSYKLCTNDDNDFSKTLRCKVCCVVGKMERIITSVNVSTFSIASPEQRKQMLKKRSRDHFQKNIKDKFHELNRTVKPKMYRE